MSKNIVWKPKVGQKVKLNTFTDYSSRGLSIWGWFEVLELMDNVCRVKTILDAVGVESTEHVFEYSLLQKPFCWSEVYQITAKDKAQAEMSKSWLDSGRGIAVWFSQDLSSAGRAMFTPGDKTDKPHWSVEIAEILHDAERFDIGYDETRTDKPTPQEKKQGGWMWDKYQRVYYRRIKLS